MKILVCISNVPDTTTKVKFVANDTKLDVTGIQWVINPWDELSLTRALELKDDSQTAVDSVAVAHVGLSTSEPTIRKALAIGADEAYRVNAEPTDAYAVASALAQIVGQTPFDIVLCGIESSDHNSSAVGGMLAEFLGIPSVSAISNLNIDGEKVTITREIDGGKETVSTQTPFVGIVQKGIAKEPKIAAMRGIMQARQKKINVLEPNGIEALTNTLKFDKPAPKAACKMVDAENARELINLLQTETKLI